VGGNRKSRAADGLIITGQPDNGKRVLLLVILLMRLAAGLPTALVFDSTNLLPFADRQVYFIPGETASRYSDESPAQHLAPIRQRRSNA